MNTIFTPELLVKYLYNETTPSETLEIKQAIAKNIELKNELDQMQFVKLSLEDYGNDTPSESTIASIIEYASQKHEVA